MNLLNFSHTLLATLQLQQNLKATHLFEMSIECDMTGSLLEQGIAELVDANQTAQDSVEELFLQCLHRIKKGEMILAYSFVDHYKPGKMCWGSNHHR